MKHSVSAVLLLMAVSRPAMADLELDALLSEEIITTASRTPESSRTAPALSTSITAEQLRIYGIRTLAEAIDFLALGVASSGPNQHGGEVELGSRGVLLTKDSGSHFLLMIEGHAINEVSYGTARFDRGAGIPLEMIDHIEVTVGPGSVLYGNNAMLGVINVIIKRGSEVDGGYVLADGGSLRSYRVGAGAGQAFELFGEQGDVVLALEYYDRKGPDFIVGPQYPDPDFETRTSRAIDTSLPWGGATGDTNYTRVPAVIFALEYGNVQIHGQAKHSTFGQPMSQHFFNEVDAQVLDKSLWFDVRHQLVLPHGVDIVSRAYVDGFTRRETWFVDSAQCGPELNGTCRQEQVRLAHWGGVEFRGSVDWWEDQVLVSSGGVDWRLRRTGSKIDRFSESTDQPLTSSIGDFDVDDTAYGAYFQQLWNPTPTLGINASARLDQDERYDPVLSPRAAVSLGLWDGGVSKLVYSKAFRAPGRFVTDLQSPERISPVDLRPETVQSMEFSVEQTTGAHRAILGVFYTAWRDMTEVHVLTGDERLASGAFTQALDFEIEQVRNVSQITNYGFNGGYRASFLDRQLTAGVNLTYALTQEERDEGDRDLTVAPSTSGNARISYTFGESLPTLGIAGAFQGTRLVDGAYSEGTNSDDTPGLRFNPFPDAAPQLDLRMTLSGKVLGFSYRLTGDYAVVDHGPYVIGPVQRPLPTDTTAELSPIKQLTGYGELSYEF